MLIRKPLRTEKNCGGCDYLQKFHRNVHTIINRSPKITLQGERHFGVLHLSRESAVKAYGESERARDVTINRLRVIENLQLLPLTWPNQKRLTGNFVAYRCVKKQSSVRLTINIPIEIHITELLLCNPSHWA